MDVTLRSSELISLQANSTEICKKFTEEEAKLKHEDAKLKELEKKLLISVEQLKQENDELVQEKLDLEVQITQLQMSEKVKQAEHSMLRDSITVVNSQTQNIRTATMECTKSRVRNIQQFENDCTNFAAQFRGSSETYAREKLRAELEQKLNSEKAINMKVEAVNKDISKWLHKNRLASDLTKVSSGEAPNSIHLPGSELYEIEKSVENLTQLIEEMQARRNAWEREQKKIKEIEAEISILKSTN